MKNYLIAKDKKGILKTFSNISELKNDIDNISSWLKIKANSHGDAIKKFPLLEDKYKEINNTSDLKHIINFDE
jgi:hypothetical protein